MPVPVFTAGEILTATNMNQVGLWRVTGCTVTSAGGTAATASNGVITVGSANTSVTVVNAFSADYQNYRVLITGIDCSVGDTSIKLSLNNSTGNTYAFSAMWNNYSTLVYGGANSGGTSSWTFGLTATTDDTSYQLEIMQPFLTKRTTFNANGTSGSNTHWGGGLDTNAVSQTGFTITPNSGNMTGGTIRVYGYRD
jgi:hypothetical protein